MKHILFLVSSMQGGGAERIAALLCNQWVKQGYSVTLMPTFSGRGECVYPLDERVKLDFLADRVGIQSRSVINKINRLLVLRRTLRKIDPDLIVSFMPPVNIAAILVTQGLKIPVIVSERIYPPSMPLGLSMSLMRKLTYSRARAVILQTKESLEWLSRTIPTAQGMVIANPISWPLAIGKPLIEPEVMLSTEKNILLAVGRLDRQKGFDLLLKAFSQITNQFPDWQLVILGEGCQRTELEHQLEQLGLKDSVYLPGRVGNLTDWYERADLYVMSSRFEGFPNTLLEAMAHGLPAVSFDCKTGPRDIIRDEIDGVLVSPDSGANGLAEALAGLMNDPDKRMIMGKHAVDVRDRFSMARVAALWNELLEHDYS